MNQSFDVLIWNDPLEKMQEPNDPCGMVNVSEEHADLSEDEAWKIYNNCKFYHKLLMGYEATDQDGNMGEDGEVLAEESSEDFEE